MSHPIVKSHEARNEVRRLCAAALEALVAGQVYRSEHLRIEAERWNSIADLLAGEEEPRTPCLPLWN